jgi:hypothetical protein
LKLLWPLRKQKEIKFKLKFKPQQKTRSVYFGKSKKTIRELENTMLNAIKRQAEKKNYTWDK